MRPETLLAKFGLKGINYDQSGGGKGVFSLEEQLAMVGLSWSESPVGFLILFTEVHKDFHSRQLLEKAVMLEFVSRCQEWRGQQSEYGLEALVKAAIEEAINPLGQVCVTCCGTGVYKTERRQKRNCVFCDDGRTPWDEHSRFVQLCSGKFACPYSMFKKRYLPLLEEVTRWLSDKRTAAVLALMETIEREEAA